jgi:K+-sensing histidine kinase KdpD
VVSFQYSHLFNRSETSMRTSFGLATAMRAGLARGSRGFTPEEKGRSGWLIVAQAFLLPVAGVAVVTVLLMAVAAYSGFTLEPIIFLIPVVICAVRWGHVSASVTALLGTLSSDFFFIPPLYSLEIADPKQTIELALFLLVAVVTANLAARLRNEAAALRRREQEIANLYDFSRRLASCGTAHDLVRAIQEYLSLHLGCEAHLIRIAADFEAPGAAEKQVPQEIAQQARATIARDTASRLVTDPQQKNLWVLKSIATEMSDHGVLAVNLGAHPVQDRRRLDERIDALLAEASATLIRVDAVAALANANRRLESDVLKTALIGTASHELRSPVAAILGSASVLDQVPALRGNAKLRALIDGMHREAKRLDTDIQNLLDTVRITDMGIKPHLVLTDPTDIFAAAIRQRSHRVTAHNLTVDIAPDLPLINVDPVLIEQAVGQIIENAAKYSPADTEIAIVGDLEGEDVVLSVTDQGVGLTAEEASEMFRRTVRGRRHVGRTPGLGLGLWIARIFVTANGGTIMAHSPGPGRGTTMSIRLPARPVAMAPAAVSDAQTG